MVLDYFLATRETYLAYTPLWKDVHVMDNGRKYNGHV